MNTRKYSKNQEKRVSKAIRGKPQLNSGATPFQKGDVKSNLFLAECKTQTIEKKSISIKSDWIEKLKEESFAMGKPFWTLVFNFGGNHLQNNENFYIIDESLFKQLQNYLEQDF